MLTGRLYVPGDAYDQEYQRGRREWEASHWGQVEKCLERDASLEDFVARLDPSRVNELVNFRDYSFGIPVTILMMAARLGRTEICRHLLKPGGNDVLDPNIRDSRGRTALLHFLEHGMVDEVRCYSLRVELLQAFLENPKVDLNLGPEPYIATEENGWNHDPGYKPAMVAFCPWMRSRNRSCVYGREVLFRMILSKKPIDLSAKTLYWVDDGKNTGPMTIMTVGEYLGRISGLPGKYVADPAKITEICTEFAASLTPEVLGSSEISSRGIEKLLPDES